MQRRKPRQRHHPPGDKHRAAAIHHRGQSGGSFQLPRLKSARNGSWKLPLLWRPRAHHHPLTCPCAALMTNTPAFFAACAAMQGRSERVGFQRQKRTV